MQKEGKYHFFPSPGLLQSRLKSEGSRHPGEERKRRGSHLPTAEPESAAARRQQRLCLRSRHRPAPPGRSEPWSSASSRGHPGNTARGSRSGCGSGCGPRPHRPALAAAAAAPPRAGPRLRPAGPPPAAAASEGEPDPGLPLSPCAPLPPPTASQPRDRAVPGRGAHSVDQPSPDLAPRNQSHLRGRAPAFSDSSPRPGVAWSSHLGAHSPEPSVTLEIPPLSSPRRGPVGLCPRGRGWREAGSSSAPAEIRPPCQVSHTLLQRRGAGRRRSWRGSGLRFGAQWSRAGAGPGETRLGGRREPTGGVSGRRVHVHRARARPGFRHRHPGCESVLVCTAAGIKLTEGDQHFGSQRKGNRNHQPRNTGDTCCLGGAF